MPGSTEIVDGAPSSCRPPKAFAQRETRRNREAVARIAASFPEHLQVESEHQSGALRGDRTIDEFLIESAIAHQILLEPERPARSASGSFVAAACNGASTEPGDAS